MPRILDATHVRPALATLLGACDVDGGPTDEQRALIDALARGYFHEPVDLAELRPLDPAEAGDAFTSAAERHRMRQLVYVLEVCRHPLTEAQVDRCDEYAAALGGDAESMSIARDLVRGGFDAAQADFYRAFNAIEPAIREPSLAGAPGSEAVTLDPALVARLEALRDCPAGSLGLAYVEFYDQWGFTLPGADAALPAATFVAHDMAHVIAGYEPTPVGEIALGAMQLAMTDSDEHWAQLLGNLGVHEAHYVNAESSDRALTRPGAVETVAHAFDRGARTATDFSVVDHLSLVDEPLDEVRQRFGVPPRQC